ncbi:MAG TPA: radical SAM protein [Deltaproteobacteria bacterium]|nr:radical SAM protein [Deltaproteobacteria bacterium]
MSIIIPMSRYVFGPVPSRRLGFSLGVDIIPRKYCTFDCIYCQVGRTTEKTVLRSSFVDPNDVIDEVIGHIHSRQPIDFVTFSGSGEPTLNKDLGSIIRALKKRMSTPIAVITNGSLLDRPDVRKDLAEADVLMPSLDAVTEDAFVRINRPAGSVSLISMIEGLRALRAEYRGQIWLEIMLIKNINDTSQHLEVLKEVVTSIGVDKIHLNTVVRPPCEAAAEGISEERLSEIQDFFGSTAEIICGFRKDHVRSSQEENWEESILAILKRRSLTPDDVARVTGLTRAQADEGLIRLLGEKRVKEHVVDGVLYYVATK